MAAEKPKIKATKMIKPLQHIMYSPKTKMIDKIIICATYILNCLRNTLRD